MTLGDHFIRPVGYTGLGDTTRQDFDTSARLFVAAPFDLPGCPVDQVQYQASYDNNWTTKLRLTLYPDNGSDYPDTSVVTITGDLFMVSAPSGYGAYVLNLGFFGSGPFVAAGRYWLVATTVNGTLQAASNTVEHGTRTTASPASLYGASLASLITQASATSGANQLADMVILAYFNDTPPRRSNFAAIVG